MVYHWVRQRWKAKLKTAHPSHTQQAPDAVAAFPEKLAWQLRSAVRIVPDLHRLHLQPLLPKQRRVERISLEQCRQLRLLLGLVSLNGLTVASFALYSGDKNLMLNVV